MTAKDLVRKIVPPIFIDLYKWVKQAYVQDDITWLGNYPSWESAMKHCKGYNSPNIVEKCKDALLKVKNGEAVYERDSVLFDEIAYSFPLVTTLLKVALEDDENLCVLDFGGSLGSSYFQNKDILKDVKNLKWCIVEQPQFVEYGKQYFENEQLSFYNTIEECLKKNKPNVLLVSSVVQYLEEPKIWIQRFIDLNIPYIIIDRTPFVENQEDILTIQKTPKRIYEASYPTWFFNFEKFKQPFLIDYLPLFVFDSFIEVPILLNGSRKASWQGIVFQRHA
jgi:putative methyltransferase (TIGR04325 family)